MLSIRRNFSTINKILPSAISVFNNSCYNKIDFKINEEMCAREAVNRFTAFNVGCLAVTDSNNKLIGVISERDYINKVAALGKNDLEVKIKDICSSGAIIVARPNDTLNQCMNKMLLKDIRHLIVIDDNNKDFIGMISIKDLIKEIQKESQETITRLSDFKIGKGAYFGSE
jgi:predicted transcriptional regulator